jgi:hypothetical protein
MCNKPAGFNIDSVQLRLFLLPLFGRTPVLRTGEMHNRSREGGQRRYIGGVDASNRINM